MSKPVRPCCIAGTDARSDTGQFGASVLKCVLNHDVLWLIAWCLLGIGNFARGQVDQPEPLDRLTAGDQAYRAADQARRRAIGTQIDLQDYIRWRAGLPDRRWLYADPPGLAGRFSTRIPSVFGRTGPWWDVDGVFAPRPIWPGEIYSYRYDNPVEQPAGDEIRPTGPNGYTYGPIYDRTPPAHGPPAPQPYAPLVPTAPSSEVDDDLETALAAFRAGEYHQALGELVTVLSQRPDEWRAELLRVQAEFALGDYAAATANLRRVLPRVPQRDRGMVVRDYRIYYASGATFRRELRALEAHLDEQPEGNAARLLLAYEYGYLGHPKQALAQLEQVLDGDPRDQLAKQLHTTFSAMIVEPEGEEPAGPRKF